MFQNIFKTIPHKPKPIQLPSSSIRNTFDKKQTIEISDNLSPSRQSSARSTIQNKPKSPFLKETDEDNQHLLISRIKDAGLQIDYYSEQSQKLDHQFVGSVQESVRQSRVLSIHDLNNQGMPPLLLSNINSNFQYNMQRVHLMRIHNYVMEIRELQGEVGGFVEQQRNVMREYSSKIVKDLGEFISQERRKVSMQYLQQIKQIQHQRDSLQTELKHKIVEVENLSKQLGDVKTSWQKQIEQNKILRKVKSRTLDQNQSGTSLDKQMHCANCKLLQVKYNTVKNYFQQSQQKLQKQVFDNEHLQQYIFDIEQKIVGVQLEVEKRLKQEMGNIKELGQKAKAEKIDQSYLANIQQLNQQVANWQQKCRHLQQICIREKDIQQKQQKLAENELNYRRKDTSLFQTINKYEQEREKIYQRERQLQVAQQNLTKKISNLRKKEAELIEWEAELMKRSSSDVVIEKSNSKQPKQYQNSFKINSGDQLNKSDQSLKSFGKMRSSRNNTQNMTLEYLSDYNIDNRVKTERAHLQQKEAAKKQYFKPDTQKKQTKQYNRLEHNGYEKYDQKEREILKARPQSRTFMNSTYIPKSRENLLENNNKKYLQDNAQTYRSRGELSPYRTRNTNLPPRVTQKTTHNYTVSRNSPNYRQTSKNSRSSATRSIRNTHKISAPVQPRIVASHAPRQSLQMAGLGSKLQRLRNEIKRELDSTK